MTAAVQCAECNRFLDEASSMGSCREPCPSCGGTRRVFRIHVVETVTVRTGMKAKHVRPGLGRPVWEGESGDIYWWRDGNKYVRLMRDFDRENNWYDEVITDPETGEIIHECHEPLSEHQGHGSANRKREKR